MAFQILLNLMIAILWMFLHNDWTASRFIIGFLLGMLVLLALRRFWPGSLYLARVWAVVKLFGIFMRELIVSSITVIRYIISPKLNIHPGIFAYETDLRTDWEVTCLACLICLTPGTLTLEVSRDNKTLYIHAIDIKDAKEHCRQINHTFEKAILEVTH